MFKFFSRDKGLTEKPKSKIDIQVGDMASTQTAPIMSQREVAKAFSTSPFLHLCVDKIAKSVASNEWKLYKTQKNGNKNLIQRHRVLDLIKNPNPFMTKFDMFYTIQGQLDLSGNAYIMYERDSKGNIINLFPIIQDMLVEYPSSVNGFSYKIQLNNSVFKVPCTEIIHFKEIDLNKPYGNGVSTASTLSDNVSTENYSSTRLKSFFYNDSQPNGIIGIDDMDDDSLLAFKERWLSEGQGFFNSYKMKFLNTTNIKYIPTQSNFTDSKILEVTKLQQETIRIAYGISPEVLGIVESSNRATAMTAKELFMTEVVEPRLIKIRDLLNITLLKEYESDLALDFSKKSDTTSDRMLELVKIMPEAFTLNEVRELAGLEVVNSFIEVYGGDKIEDTPKIKNISKNKDKPKNEEDNLQVVNE